MKIIVLAGGYSPEREVSLSSGSLIANALIENGQLQALLDIYGITYTGSSYEGCLLSMNKDISKKLMLTAGVKTADWKTYNLNSLELHN